MRISRLYLSTALNPQQIITLDDDSGHYLRTVLRLKEQAKIIVFNGLGGEYLGTLVEMSRKTVRIHLEQFIARSVESNLQLHLGLGIARGDRMDFSVQKAVELGVTHITPLITARVQFNAEKNTQRLTHWQKIAQHAAEQSGRTLLPALSTIEHFADWLPNAQGLKIFLDPYAESTLKQLHSEQSCVTLLTGPEGGFSDEERQLAKAAGFIPIRLGQRVLRTETASLAALSAVQLLWGDFA